MNKLFILVGGSDKDGLPVPLVAREHLDDVIRYIREHLRYYPYEYLKICSVNLSDTLNVRFVDGKILIQ